ncbi:MAG: hypothetical protein H6581_30350 [Bacteroidia bacterium]|nr:hypothetical protein [Bacteroidia bacterium]
MRTIIIVLLAGITLVGFWGAAGKIDPQGSVRLTAEKHLPGVGLGLLENSALQKRTRHPFARTVLDVQQYEEMKEQVRMMRDELRARYLAAESDAERKQVELEAEVAFTHALRDQLIPFWYGTTWDFNGTTRTPGNGKIACGYFVTTLLEDMGLTLDRVRLAREASFNMMREVTRRDPVWMSGRTPKSLSEWVRGRQASVYIIGLDFHTGFLFWEKESVWFVHASYLAPKVVLKERVEGSAALAQSRVFVLAELVGNEDVMGNWLGIN